MGWDSELNRLTKEGYLRRVVSDCGNLVVWNYTDKCTYDRHWNPITLNARGTVYHAETGEVVAKAFPKFFNFSELPEERQSLLLSKKDYRVYEKVDGSLGIVYYWNGEWRINTRGSFTSEQAQYARDNLLHKYRLRDDMYTGVTFLVEIVYPENRIIVDYGETEQLVLLGAYNAESGDEYLQHDLETFSKQIGLPLTKQYSVDSIEELIERQSILPASDEGYVVRFSNGERVKFKSLEYLRVARIMSGASPLALWESFTTAGTIDTSLLEGLPEEFRPEIDRIVSALERQYITVRRFIVADSLVVNGMTKRDVGLGIKDGTLSLSHPSVIFSAIDGNEEKVHRYILKVIKPSGNRLKEL